MPEVEYVTTLSLPREPVWDFVKDMNNWAPFLTGYQKHCIVDETDSIWTLKGDVGILSRVVELRAHITEWNGPERVSFTLTGLNESVEGGGTLKMETVSPVSPVSIDELAKTEGVQRHGFGRRLLGALFRFFYRLLNGAGAARRALPGKAARGGVRSRLTFTLRMDAGGPMGPLVNAMLAPALEPAAEDLANRIAARLEDIHGLAGGH
jgi:carbon monoxide dehydrogenase subunit G